MAPVPEYHLHLDPGDLRWLKAHPGTKRCFPGCLQVSADRWPIWLGYRGRYSRLFPKASFDLWFPPEARFHGHRQLHLSAAYRDPSLLRGRLSLELSAALGVPAPQAWHAWVTLNGEPQGLYTVVESVNRDWLLRRGLPDGPPNVTGNSGKKPWPAPSSPTASRAGWRPSTPPFGPRGSPTPASPTARAPSGGSPPGSAGMPRSGPPLSASTLPTSAPGAMAPHPSEGFDNPICAPAQWK